MLLSLHRYGFTDLSTELYALGEAEARNRSAKPKREAEGAPHRMEVR